MIAEAVTTVKTVAGPAAIAAGMVIGLRLVEPYIPFLKNGRGGKHDCCQKARIAVLETKADGFKESLDRIETKLDKLIGRL